MPLRISTIALLLIALLGISTGCSAKKAVRADLESYNVGAAQPASELDENHFKTDRTGNVSEDELRHILASPVFLAEDPRIGVIEVETAHDADDDVPLSEVPRQLGDALEGTGFIEVATEIVSGWQTDTGIGGLRELAARYRADYMLLYRHRFVEHTRTNAWGVSWATFLGGFVTPHRSVEMDGVLEATLFDVKTGTILFTVHQRVHETESINIWHGKYKRRALKDKMIEEATDKLTEKMTGKVRRLVAARPQASATEGRATGDHSGPNGDISTMR